MLPPRKKTGGRQATQSQIKKRKGDAQKRKFDGSFIDESAEISLIMPQNVNDSAFLSQYTSKPSKYVEIRNQSKHQSSQNSELADENPGFKRINSYFKRKSSI